MNDNKPCDASTYYNAGASVAVNCELDAGHAGLHRFGEHHHTVIYWSTPFDRATRAELIQELSCLRAMLSIVDGDKAELQFVRRMNDISMSLFGLATTTTRKKQQ